MYLGADHPEGLGARVDVVQAWLDCLHVSAKLLVDAVVGLRYDFVGVVDEAATQTGHPGSSTTTALAPAVHALAVEGHFSVVLVSLGEVDVFGFAVEPVSFLQHSRYQSMIISTHLNILACQLLS